MQVSVDSDLSESLIENEAPSTTTPGPTAPSQDEPHSAGTSTVAGAVFNFTNSIVGAGAIGLGGAFAASGGLVSAASVVTFALLTKLSLDLVIALSIEQHHASFEQLGWIAFGLKGQLLVMASKFLYSFGCLVAYVVVVKDNFGPAVKSLLYGDHQSDSPLYHLLERDSLVTWTVSIAVILPLCLLRNASALASASIVSIVAMMAIVAIVIYLYIDNPHDTIRQPGGSTYENWFEIRPGVLECLGTFVFTFVSQHTCHLTFQSLQPNLQTVDNWKRISTYSLSIAGAISLSVGVVVYMTFWQATRSDIFDMYPSLAVISFAKLLLCTTMLLTFPLPFFTCRELIVVFFSRLGKTETPSSDPLTDNDLQEPLLTVESGHSEPVVQSHQSLDPSTLSSQALTALTTVVLPEDDKQLTLPYHILVTCKLWFVVTGLAVEAPSLGDVLDLVGCATGTMIAFVFPALLAFRLRGFSHSALLILVVGGAVGIVGTYFSLKKLIEDI